MEEKGARSAPASAAFRSRDRVRGGGLRLSGASRGRGGCGRDDEAFQGTHRDILFNRRPSYESGRNRVAIRPGMYNRGTDPMTPQQLIFLVIVAVTLILFISEKIRIDIAAMLTLLALAATGILTPSEALSGFASEPAIIVASVFVISAALTETGLTERIGAGIARAAGSREWRAILVVMPAVAALAAFSHHLMITAMMLPIMMRLARVQNLSPSRLLMPMSLAASLGTTLTIFSAPAFLLMNHLLQTSGQTTLGIFGITPIGVALVLLAIVYMFLNRWILPKRKARADEADYLRLDRYYTELIVEPKSRWIGQPMADFNRYYDGRLEVVEWLRGGVPQHNKNRGSVLAEGDVMFVSATPDEIVSVESEPGLALHAVKKYGETRSSASSTSRPSSCRWSSRRTRRSSAKPSRPWTSTRPSTSSWSACGAATPGSATDCRRCS